MKTRSIILLFAVLLAAAGTAFPAPAADDEALPPADLLAGNLEQCEAALELLAAEVVEAERYGGGSSGYVRYRVTGTVTRAIKGTPKTGETLTYCFTQEVDASSTPAVRAGERYLVFLARDADGQYWPIAEVGQFASSPALLARLCLE